MGLGGSGGFPIAFDKKYKTQDKNTKKKSNKVQELIFA
jgi:hypothetical protein